MPLENITVNGRVSFKVSDLSAILVDFEQKTHFLVGYPKGIKMAQ